MLCFAMGCFFTFFFLNDLLTPDEEIELNQKLIGDYMEEPQVLQIKTNMILTVYAE